jgi:predicted metal-dependent hydrolase
MSRMFHKNIEYKVKYRNIKYPRLEFKTGTLKLILPQGENPMDIIEKHRKWIIKKQNFIEKYLKAANRKRIVKRTDKEFRELVHNLVWKGSEGLKVKVNKIFFRRMRTKWASCSPKKNLTINTMMKYLPKNLIEYIIYHELTHLIEKRHNERFWKIVRKKFNKHEDFERMLFSYWFSLIRKTEKKFR